MTLDYTPAPSVPKLPPPPQAVHLNRERHPFGLRAIIALLILQIVTSIITIAGYWYYNPQWLTVAMSSVEHAKWFLYVGLLHPVLIIARVTAIIGLWRRRPWAWFLTMALLTYAMASDIYFYFQGEFSYLSMTLNVVTVFYLNLREVQELFVTEPAKGRS